MKILFALCISLDYPGPSVHLLKDIIKTFEEEDLFSTTVIEKSFTSDAIMEHGNHLFFPFKKTNKRFLFARYNREIRYFKQIICYLKVNKLNFDAVFIQSSPVAYILIDYFRKFTNSKIIYNAQDIFPDNAMLLSRSNRVLLHRFVYKTLQSFQNSDLIITISDDMRETIINKGISENRVITIYNWASPRTELDEKRRCILSEDERLEKKFIVLYAGNIGRFQDVETIVEAANLIQNKGIIFTIIGDGTILRRILKKAELNKNKNLIFYPSQPFDDMPYIYSYANVNIVSLRKGAFKTALPSKFAFCLNAQQPIILSIEANSKTSQLLANTPNIFICEPGNPRQLSKTVLRIYEANTQCTMHRSFEFGDKDITSLISDRNSVKYKKAILDLLNCKRSSKEL